MTAWWAVRNNAAPDTRPAPLGWMARAACRRPQYAGHGDLWFPALSDVEARTAAMKVCRRCPAAQACAAWALSRGEEHGIWGGLDERARRRLRRSYRDRLTDPAAVAQITADELSRPSLRLRTAYEQRTEPDGDGHVRWTVNVTTVKVDRRVYTPRRLAFAYGYGRRAEGTVHTWCGRTDCVAPEHLTDDRMRRAQKRRAAA